jgi:hypothetical protein
MGLLTMLFFFCLRLGPNSVVISLVAVELCVKSLVAKDGSKCFCL